MAPPLKCRIRVRVSYLRRTYLKIVHFGQELPERDSASLEDSAAWTARTLRARLVRRYGRLTVSPARTNVALFIHRAVRLAAALAPLTASSEQQVPPGHGRFR